MKKLLILAVTLLTTASYTFAQTPLWQGKGRIAISSDGNEHDDDDWAATPLSLAMLAARGLQDKVVLYTYSDHIWGSNQSCPNNHGMSAYEHMRESALGGAREFGFDNTKFICAVDNAEVAYNAMKDVINASSASDPLIIIAAGPMQVVGEALNRADKDKLKYVTVLSHSWWNDNHSDHPDCKSERWYSPWDDHEGWTWDEMEETFKAAKFVHIKDQNGRKEFEGLQASIDQFDWIKTSPAQFHKLYKRGSWEWLYSRISTVVKEDCKSFDPSDAGMVVYLLTGVEETNPAMAREIMENPVPRVK